MKFFTPLVLLTLSLIIAPRSSAQSEPDLDLQDGDTFVFLGDSITHQCLYTQYIETFFYTRYPDRKILFRNAGVSGDKAGDALARFEKDVKQFAPKYVSILLGMNDGQYEPFNPETVEVYTKGMTEILDRLDGIGAKPIVMSPTMFDHHQLHLRMKNPDAFRFSHKTFDPNYNSLLAYFSGWLRESAGTRQVPFVNQWGPMNDITFLMRRDDPDFSLIADAIHPGGAGQFLMAFELIDQVSPDRRNVGSITITPRGNKWVAGTGGTGIVTDLQVFPKGDYVAFTHTARSLPWVVPSKAIGLEEEGKWENDPQAPLGYTFTKAGHKLSAERIKISGLAPGNYELFIDRKTTSKVYSHVQLGTKIEIQEDSATPQYQQAMRVAELNREKNDLAVRPLRDLWGRLKGQRRKRAATGMTDEEFSQIEAKHLADVSEKLKLIEDYENRIYEAAKPVPRTYEFRPVDIGRLKIAE